MENKGSTGRTGSAFKGAVLSPVLMLLLAATGIGLLFAPAIGLYLDGRNRTEHAKLSLVLLCVGLYLWQWQLTLAVSIFLLILLFGVLAARRYSRGFDQALLLSLGVGMLAAVAALAVFSAVLQEPVNTALAAALTQLLRDGVHLSGSEAAVDMSAVIAQLTQSGISQLEDVRAMYSQIAAMGLAAKLGVVQAFYEESLVVALPVLSLQIGVLAGGFTLFMPWVTLARRENRTAPTKKPVPSFAAVRMPRYLAGGMVALVIVSWLGMQNGNVAMQIAFSAAFQLLMLGFSLQALAVAAFFFNRWRMPVWVQILLFIPMMLLTGRLLSWVGLFDSLFDFRTMKARMDAIRGMNPEQAREYIERLRREDEQKRQQQNDDHDDGEDPRQ